MPQATTTTRPFPRPPMAAASAVLFTLVGIVALRVHDGTGPLRVDDAAARVIDSHRLSHALARTEVFALGSRSLFRGAVNLGSPLVIVPVVLALVGLALYRHDRLAVVVCLAGPVVAMVLTEAVGKPLVDRHRDHALTFPSGHATGAAAVATLVVLLLFRWRGARTLPRWAPVAAAVPLLVSMAVVGLGWHYPTDAGGGMAVGVASVLAVAALLPEPRRRPSPAAVVGPGP